MQINYSKKFIKLLRKINPEIKDYLKEKILIFRINKFDPRINNHKLKGKFKKYRSINITGDYRAIFEEIAEDNVYFVSIGTHSELYA